MSFDEQVIEARRWCWRCRRPTWQVREPYWEPGGLIGCVVWPIYWLLAVWFLNPWQCERCWKIKERDSPVGK